MRDKKFFKKKREEMEYLLIVIIAFLIVLTWKAHRIDKVLHQEKKIPKNERFWGYGKKK